MKKETNFEKMLEKFDEAGNSASCGKWSIAKGGYDLWWEIYYGGQCVLRCIAGEVEIESVFDLFETSRKSELLNILMMWDKELKFSVETTDVICKARRYNISQRGGDCPANCPYCGCNTDGICGAECQECGGNLFLTHDDRVYCTDCGYYEEHVETPADDASEVEERADLGSFTVDVKLLSNGKFDVWIAHDGSSGSHYTDVTADQIGEYVADDVECIAENYQCK